MWKGIPKRPARPAARRGTPSRTARSPARSGCAGRDAGIDDVDEAVSSWARSGLALTRNSQAAKSAFSRCACSTIPAEMSMPIAVSKRDPSARVSRPTPQPKSSARTCRAGRPSVSATDETWATSCSPVAKNSSTSQRPPLRPETVSTAQSGSISARCSQSCRCRSRLTREVRSGVRRPPGREAARPVDPHPGVQVARSRGFSIRKANRFACRGSIRVSIVTTGRARRAPAHALRGRSPTASGSSNSRKKRIRWRAWGANEATVFSTSRSDQR